MSSSERALQQKRAWREANRTHCQEYQRVWRKKNWKHVYEYSKGYREKTYQDNIEYLENLKKTTPCKDCGKYDEHYLMQFDHVGTKRGRVSSFAGCRKTMLDELVNCEIVCVRCHAIRTHVRGQLKNAKKARNL